MFLFLIWLLLYSTMYRWFNSNMLHMQMENCHPFSFNAAFTPFFNDTNVSTLSVSHSKRPTFDIYQHFLFYVPNTHCVMYTRFTSPTMIRTSSSFACKRLKEEIGRRNEAFALSLHQMLVISRFFLFLRTIMAWCREEWQPCFYSIKHSIPSENWILTADMIHVYIQVQVAIFVCRQNRNSRSPLLLPVFPASAFPFFLLLVFYFYIYFFSFRNNCVLYICIYTYNIMAMRT